MLWELKKILLVLYNQLGKTWYLLLDNIILNNDRWINKNVNKKLLTKQVKYKKYYAYNGESILKNKTELVKYKQKKNSANFEASECKRIIKIYWYCNLFNIENFELYSVEVIMSFWK